MSLTIGSLFSGIGGLDLGLEAAGIGPVLWQVEIDKRCRSILAKHWPDTQRFDDVRHVGAATLTAVDVICGGFPCQDVSSAGKRTGLSGTRSGLWFEFLRIVSELRPQWVVVENVASGAHAWVDTVLTGLGEQGYACLPFPLAAADVGAPHLRRRIFVVAHLDQGRELVEPFHAKVAEPSELTPYAHSTELRDEPGRSARQNWRGETLAPLTGEVGTIADNDAARREGAWTASHARRRRLAVDGWRSPVPDVLRVVHGLPRKLDGARSRIASLGNSVVPQCAEVIGHVIQELAR